MRHADDPPRDQPSLRGVEQTAIWVAMVRAQESTREDRLFDDPYASAFVAAAPVEFPEAPSGEAEHAALGPLASLGTRFYVSGVIRTRFFDDYLMAAAAAGCRQVVLLAAGLDTRAFRLAWPEGTRLFEIDLPDVIEFKNSVLASRAARPRCERITVEADLREDWAARLTKAGFDGARPTAWLAEGLMLYLTGGEARRLLTGITALSEPDSQLSFEHSPAATAALLAQARFWPMADYGSSNWKGGMGRKAPHWLDVHGWRTEIRELAEMAEAYQRPIIGPASDGFLTAVRLSP